ncbi:MAG: hypothetical protein JSV44_10145 [Candidatus Zixiibacteriota bacterium]|nr:MAG: hypothetical protein JSV44_10145 [candidate division Zixibacteria bacterium]
MRKLAEPSTVDRKSIAAAVIDAAARGATVGEITQVLRANKAEGARAIPVAGHRGAEPFEKLRRAVEMHRAENNRLKVCLVTLGPVGGYTPRLDFIASFFEIGGFEVVRTGVHDTPQEAADAGLSEAAPVIVICGPDNACTKGAPVAARRIKAVRPETIVVLASVPREDRIMKRCTDAGVDIFIHTKSNILEVLGEVASKLRVSV